MWTHEKPVMRGNFPTDQGLPESVCRSGFTLLEILIAIFIFAVVISTIFGTFNAVISRTEAIKNGMGSYEMAQNCLNRMNMDLSAVYVEQKPLYHPPDYDDPPDPYRFIGREAFVGNKNFSWLRFTSTEHLSMTRQPEQGIAEIVYYVKEQGDSDAGFVLKRSDVIYPYDKDYEFEEKDSDPVLCENIEAFKVLYFDADENEYETWDSDDDRSKYSTPCALSIQLTIKNNDGAFPFHTRITLPARRAPSD